LNSTSTTPRRTDEREREPGRGERVRLGARPQVEHELAALDHDGDVLLQLRRRPLRTRVLERSPIDSSALGRR
jgi:hypothetical protein